MAKKLTKEERMLKRSKLCYEEIKDEIGLTGSNEEQIAQLIDKCCELQCEICKNSDIIKINNFDKALELIHIDKSTWMEFVNITAKKYYGRLKEKAVDKYEDMCQSKRHIANLKQSFYDSYLSDNPLKVVDEYDKQTYDFDNEENKEFQNLMEESAKIRDYINNSLYKMYKTYYQCAYYLSEGELTYGDFKNLVDWQYYKDSEDPKYPDRAWKIFEKFNHMVRLYNKYSINKLNEHMSDMRHEFGIQYTIGTEQPKHHAWQTKPDNENE